MTYTVSSSTAVTDDGNAPEGSSATFKNTYTSNKVQLTKNNSMTLTLRGYAGNKITGIKLSMKSNKSSGTGSFSATVGATEISSISTANFNSPNWAGKWSQEYVYVTPAVTATEVGADEDVVIKIAATANSLYCQSFSITYEPIGGGDTGGEEPETPVAPDAPTLTASCNFDNAMHVEITNNAEYATVYYTTDGTDPSASNGIEYTAPFEITTTTTVKAVAVKDKLESEVVIATYTKNGEVVDVLTRELTGVTSGATNYSNWTGKTSNSSAVYAGNSAGSNDAIQLRSNNNNSGIVTTASGGKVKKIIVEWQANTSDGRTLNVYGKNGAYTAPTDLYDDSKSGTKLGTIVKGTSTELEITGDYTYVGLRSNGSAMYLTSITIIWDTNTTQTPTVPAAPTINPNSSEFVGSQEITISAEDGADIYYTLDGSEPQEGTNKYTIPFTITGTTTVKAIAVNTVGASEVTTATYTRVVESPTITFEGNGEFEGSLVVTIEPADGTTAHYTLNGNDPDNNSDECPATLTLKADATLKVIAYEGELVSPLYTKEFTLKESNTATLVEDVADLKVGDEVVIVAADYNYALSTEDRDNNRGAIEITKTNSSIELNKNVQIITLEDGLVDETFAFKTDDGYLYAASSTSNYLKTKAALDNNGSWSISVDSDGFASIVANGMYTHNVIRFNNSNSPKIFSCYLSGQQDVSLYKVDLETVEDHVLTVSAAGWATLYLGYSVTIPGDVNCYVISELGEGTATLEKVTGVLPANTGVIVEATKGEYTFEVAETADDVESILTGTLKNEYVKAAGYVLGVVDGNVGLYMAEMNGGVFLNNANKAYLPVSALTASAQGAKVLKFCFDDQTTGINGVATGKKPEVIFDLYGRKVNNATAPGLYIINGKKVMVK